jgi:putative phosphoesterase
MLLGVVSDVHCNFAALETAFERLSSYGVDAVLCAGDAVFEYRISHEVLALLRERAAHTIAGNHEITVMSPRGERARAAPHVQPPDLDYLASLPTRFDMLAGTRRLLMIHGSPWPPYFEYLTPNHPKLHVVPALGADIVVLGHTHVAMAERRGDTLVVNPGSLGIPSWRDGQASVSFGVVDTDSLSAEIIFIPDPSGLPPSVRP